MSHAFDNEGTELARLCGLCHKLIESRCRHCAEFVPDLRSHLVEVHPRDRLVKLMRQAGELPKKKRKGRR